MLDDCILGDELSEWHSSVHCTVQCNEVILIIMGSGVKTIKFQCTSM